MTSWKIRMSENMYDLIFNCVKCIKSRKANKWKNDWNAWSFLETLENLKSLSGTVCDAHAARIREAKNGCVDHYNYRIK